MNLTPLKKTAPHRGISYVKSRLKPNVPVHTMLLHDGFLEHALIKDGHEVYSHTNISHIYNFWQCLSEDARRLHKIVVSLDKKSSSNVAYHYDHFRATWNSREDKFMRAALFFLVSISSDQGTISAGKIEPNAAKNFLLSKLRVFEKNRRWNPLYHHDISLPEQINKIEKSHKIVTPVGFYNYDFLNAAKRYGIEQYRIIHKDIKVAFDSSDNLILMYFYNPDLLDLYDNQHITMIDAHSNITTKEKECWEIVIDKP